MDEQATVAELWSLLQEQRTEIAELKERLTAREAEAAPIARKTAASGSNGHDNTPAAIERRLSRAGLLKAAAAGVAGLAAAEMAGGPRPAMAAVGTETVLKAQHLIAEGGTHDAIFTRGLNYDRGAVLQGQSFGVYAQSITTTGALGSGIGVQGDSGTGNGVKGTTSAARRLGIGGPLIGGTGVDGESLAGVGVRGLSHTGQAPAGSSYIAGIGVLGVETSNRGVGVDGRSFADASETTFGAGTGVQGVSGSGAGVQGKSTSGLGVQGDSDTLIGVQGTTAGNLFGIYGRNIANQGVGVTGRVYTDASQNTLGAGTGVLGESGSSFGVWGTTIGGAGVLGSAYSDGTHANLGSGTGVWGQSGGGTGVKGSATGGTGVRGDTGDGTGVLGTANGGTGIKGTATGTGTGVWGEGGVGIRGISSGSQLTGVYGVNTTNDGVGVAGRSYADSGQGALGAGFGVWGDSGGGVGVKGSASTGRGGVFTGGAAQIQLVPSTAASPPTSGQKGDLFLDANAKLWLCTQGGATAIWVTMGTGGGGGTTGPLVAHSTVAGTPGVLADNNSNDPNSVGVSASSLDGSGNPGAGIGLLAQSGSGTAVKGTATSGRGGIFSGGAAPLQLVPASGSHPASGQAGDLVVDSSNQLWLCQGGSSWLQLGAGGGGGGGGPLAGVSTAAGTPGVEGDNKSNDPASTGMSGKSLDGNGNPGAGIGVQGSSGSGLGVYGTSTSQSGVRGESASAIGIEGRGGTGRGGVFSGGAAALQLLPAGGAHPASGLAGDLVVDSSNNLWFCQGGANWVQLGAAGAGGGGPLTGHSTVIATPGVYGYNDTSDAKSIGINGASVDTQGNPGSGIGVQGKATWGFGVSGHSDNSIGVEGSTNADNAPAIQGRNAGNGTGVLGIAASLGIGVDGESSGGVGVQGFSTDGRGAVFGGGTAQLQLKPGATRPGTGQAGDFYLDSSNQLWFCKGGTSWVQLA